MFAFVGHGYLLYFYFASTVQGQNNMLLGLPSFFFQRPYSLFVLEPDVLIHLSFHNALLTMRVPTVNNFCVDYQYFDKTISTLPFKIFCYHDDKTK
eukprot:UN11154